MCTECAPRNRLHRTGHCGCGCGFRRYISPEEEKESLENYREQLKKEIAGVDDRIKELGRN